MEANGPQTNYVRYAKLGLDFTLFDDKVVGFTVQRVPAGNPSNPLELLVQLFPREDQRRGAAVGTMMGIGHEVTLLQERGDLLRGQAVAGLDRRFAGDRVQRSSNRSWRSGCLPSARIRSSSARNTSIGLMLASIAG